MTFFHLLLYFLLPSFSVNSGTVQLKVSNIQTSKGTIMVAIFNTESSFLKDGEAYAAREVPVDKSGSLTISFEDLPYDTYTIAIIHDSNDNKKLDTNLLGIPKEPYGFSNNARSKWGPPEYEIAKFDLEQFLLQVEIQVKKWSKQ